MRDDMKFWYTGYRSSAGYRSFDAPVSQPIQNDHACVDVEPKSKGTKPSHCISGVRYVSMTFQRWACGVAG